MVGLSQNEMGVNLCRQQDKFRISCSLTVHFVTQPWWSKSLVMHLNLWDNHHAGLEEAMLPVDFSSSDFWGVGNCSESCRPVFWSSWKYFFQYLTATIRKYLTSMDLRVFGEKFSIIFKEVANVDFIVVLPGLVLDGRGWGKWGIGDLASTWVWQTVFWWWRLLVRRDGGGECPETECGGGISFAVLGMPLCTYIAVFFLHSFLTFGRIF